VRENTLVEYNMKKMTLIVISLLCSLSVLAKNVDSDSLEKFAKQYFAAWSATQSPTASKKDIENYLAFLVDDIGHQHLPYDPIADRSPEGKINMLKGMTYYLGVHTEYSSDLLSVITGYNVVIIKYLTNSKGKHPQTGEINVQSYSTIEVLEMENGKVSIIRKYSE
jgi:hypothetical protein